MLIGDVVSESLGDWVVRVRPVELNCFRRYGSVRSVFFGLPSRTGTCTRRCRSKSSTIAYPSWGPEPFQLDRNPLPFHQAAVVHPAPLYRCSAARSSSESRSRVCSTKWQRMPFLGSRCLRPGARAWSPFGSTALRSVFCRHSTTTI